MKHHVDIICQTAYFGVRRIGPIRQFLTTKVAKTVTSLVFSRLAYCNSLLAGIHHKLVDKVQRVMNCAARLVSKAPRREHGTPLLVDLHWLHVDRRIEYKIATICYNVITGTALPLMSNLLVLHIPSRTLRPSADTRIFRIPNRRKKFQGQHAFFVTGPCFLEQASFLCATCSNLFCPQATAQESG